MMMMLALYFKAIYDIYLQACSPHGHISTNLLTIPSSELRKTTITTKVKYYFIYSLLFFLQQHLKNVVAIRLNWFF